MKSLITHCLQIFPVPDLEKTADFYSRLGFKAVFYTGSVEPHACLYRDGVEIVLIRSSLERIKPNRELHGYGYDAYFITDNQEELQDELIKLGIKIVRSLNTTDYSNREFVFEDIDGRWVAIGTKVG